MAVLSYVTQFHTRIIDMYGHELKSSALYNSNPDIKIIGAKDIKIPRIAVSGYKDHDRNTLGFNGGNYSNNFETKSLDHDRDIEFFIDPMDIKGTKSTERPSVYKGKRCFCCVGGTNLVLFHLTLIQALFACLGTDDCTCLG